MRIFKKLLLLVLVASGTSSMAFGMYEPLYNAVFWGHAEDVISLLESIPTATRAEFVLNYRDAQRSTLLHCAGKRGPQEIVRILLEAIPTEQRVEFIMVKDEYGYTVLHWAACFNRVEILNALLEFVPLEQRFRVVVAGSEDGSTALCYAITWRRPAMARLLIEAVPGAQRLEMLNAKNCFGFSALYSAMVEMGGHNEELDQALLSFLPENLQAKFFRDRKAYLSIKEELGRASKKRSRDDSEDANPVASKRQKKVRPEPAEKLERKKAESLRQEKQESGWGCIIM